MNGFETTSIIEGNSTYQKITLPGVHEYLSEEGKPRLPVVRRLVAVPDSVTLHIALSDTSLYTLPGYPVYPAPCVSYPDTGCLCFIESFCPDTDFYETETLYPETAFEVSQTGYMREQKIVELRIFPIRCDPSSEKLFVNTFSHINISYEGTPYFNTKGLGPFEEIAGLGSVCYEPWESPPPAPPDSSGGADAGQILNLGGGQDGGVQPGPVKCLKYLEELKVEGTLADYIVIAAPAYYDELYYPPRESYMDSLLLWRKNFNELCVAVASTEQIDEEFGETGGCWVKIQAFLKYAYEHYEAPNMEDDKIGYVLILGDDCMYKHPQHGWKCCIPYDTEKHVPTPYNENVPEKQDVPTDHWYQTLSGDDDIPDVLLGRFPASNSDEMQRIAKKVYRYERYLPEYRGNWRRNASYVRGANLEGRKWCDDLAEEIFDPIGYSLSCLDYDDDPELTLDDFYDEFNIGRNLVYVDAHGDRDYIYLGIDMEANVDDVLGSYYLEEKEVEFPVMVTVCCWTAKYYEDTQGIQETVGEAFLSTENKGALAYFGYVKPGSTDYNRDLFKGVENIFINNITEMGKVLVGIKLLNLDGEFILTLLGDPLSDIGEHIAYPDLPNPFLLPSYLNLPWRNALGDSLPLSVYVKNTGGATADGFLLNVDITSTNAGSESWSFPIDSLEAREGMNFDFKWDVTGMTTHIEDVDMNVYFSYSDTSVSMEEVESWVADDTASVARDEIQLQPDREGWPVKLSGNLSSSPVLYDLDGNDTLVIILGASDGWLHVFQENGEELPEYWPVEFATYEERGVIRTSPAVGDIDGDENPDVVCIVYWPNTKTTDLYAFQHDGLPVSMNWPVSLNKANIDHSPILGDFDSSTTGLEILIVDDQIRTFSGQGDQIWSYDYGYADGYSIPGAPALGAFTDENNPEIVFHPLITDLWGDTDGCFTRLKWDGEVLLEMEELPVSRTASALVNWGNQDTLECLVPYFDESGNHNLTSVDSNYDENPDWIGKECGKKPSTPALGKVDIDQFTDVAIGADWSNVTGHDGLEINLFDYKGDVTFSFIGSESEVGSIIGSPIIGDVDSNGRHDVLAVTTNGYVYSIDKDGYSLTNFAWPFNVHALSSVGAPAIGDLDGDDYLDVVVCGGDNYLYVWDMNPGGDPPDSLSTPEWPVFRRDPAHTGCYDE